MSSGAAWGCGMWFWATVLGWFSSPKFFPPESKAKLGLIPDREEWSPVDTAKDSGCFQKHREKMGLFDRETSLPFVPCQWGVRSAELQSVTAAVLWPFQGQNTPHSSKTTWQCSFSVVVGARKRNILSFWEKTQTKHIHLNVST